MILGPTAIDSSHTISFYLLEPLTSIILHLTAIAQMLFYSESAKMHPAQSMEGNLIVMPFCDLRTFLLIL